MLDLAVNPVCGQACIPATEVAGSAVYDGVAPVENARAMLESAGRARPGSPLAGVTKEGE